MPLLTAFTDVIGPVLLIGLAGYLLGRISPLTITPLLVLLR